MAETEFQSELITRLSLERNGGISSPLSAGCWLCAWSCPSRGAAIKEQSL
jgi:hypothetical protein